MSKKHLQKFVQHSQVSERKEIENYFNYFQGLYFSLFMKARMIPDQIQKTAIINYMSISHM